VSAGRRVAALATRIDGMVSTQATPEAGGLDAAIALYRTVRGNPARGAEAVRFAGREAWRIHHEQQEPVS
jgi:hypothetical protein